MGLPARARNALVKAGYDHSEDVAVNFENLTRLRGIGSRSKLDIREALVRLGYSIE